MAAPSRDQDYDVAVVGSGIAGSTAALCLSRAGLRTLVIERGTHPRFAIGEGTVPSTTLGYDYLARRYGVPELFEVVHYLGLKNIGAAGFPKQSFWFGHHEPGARLDPTHELMMETFELPLGPDVHMVRADVDAYLVSRYARYGIDYLDDTRVTDYATDSDGARIGLETPGGAREVRARLVLDASGHASFFAHRYGLRDDPPQLHTNTRGLFGHFTGVPEVEDVLGRPNPTFRFHRHGGTQHHCFKGGWIWVIPFDNGVTSVGFLLDPRVHPPDESLSPEDEIERIIAPYPTVQEHLGGMKPVRKIARTGRIQFTSRTILGDRFILTPHAAGFIDPLFSTGLTLTMSFVARFVPLAVRALHRPELDMEAFRPLETAFFSEVETVDQVVSGTLASFGNYEVFKQYWRVWGYTSIADYLARMVCDQGRADGPALVFGAGFSHVREVLGRMHTTLMAAEHHDDALARRLEAIMDELPHPSDTSRFEVGAPVACNVRIDIGPGLFPWLRRLVSTLPELRRHRSLWHMLGFLWRLHTRRLTLAVRVRLSRLRDTPFHRTVGAIRSLRLDTAEPRAIAAERPLE